MPSPRFPVIIPGTVNTRRYSIHQYVILHDKREFVGVNKFPNQLTLSVNKRKIFWVGTI